MPRRLALVLAQLLRLGSLASHEVGYLIISVTLLLIILLLSVIKLKTIVNIASFFFLLRVDIGYYLDKLISLLIYIYIYILSTACWEAARCMV